MCTLMLKHTTKMPQTRQERWMRPQCKKLPTSAKKCVQERVQERECCINQPIHHQATVHIYTVLKKTHMCVHIKISAACGTCRY